MISNYNQIGVYLNSSDVNSISGNIFLENDKCIAEENCQGNAFGDNGDCTYGESEDGGGNAMDLIILISVISGGAVIVMATLLLFFCFYVFKYLFLNLFQYTFGTMYESAVRYFSVGVTPPEIPGYNIIALIGVSFVVTLLFANRKHKRDLTLEFYF